MNAVKGVGNLVQLSASVESQQISGPASTATGLVDPPLDRFLPHGYAAVAFIALE